MSFLFVNKNPHIEISSKMILADFVRNLIPWMKCTILAIADEYSHKHTKEILLISPRKQGSIRPDVFYTMNFLPPSLRAIVRNSFSTIIVRGTFGFARIIIFMILAKCTGQNILVCIHSFLLLLK